jgi:AbiV family abortive infection protein
MFEFLKKSSKIQNKALTKEQLATLLHFCYCNASDLYEEATLLRENKKYARAFFLCALALEELAKLPIAMNALVLPPDDTLAWKGFWKTFNSHARKQEAARTYGQGMLKAHNKERWSKYYATQIPEGLPLHELKLAGMYVDCYDGVPLRPNKIFTQDAGSVSSLFEVVKKRLDAWAEIHSTIDKSIEFVKSAVKSSLKIKINDQDYKEVIIDEFRKRAGK